MTGSVNRDQRRPVRSVGNAQDRVDALDEGVATRLDAGSAIPGPPFSVSTRRWWIDG